ncbi:hypothetical protein [Knoellia sp. LjRoot47]|uniref:hypothetical protein n=1 Tax=Knoellia sp. LjRoot47 TaxID=3342330 RepID=UPI003ECFCAEB
MTNFDVRTEDISGHGRRVGTFADRLSNASAAGQTSLDPSAFGLINAPLALLAVGFAKVGQHAVSNLSMDMEETMIGLNNTVTQYNSDDDNASTTIANAGQR